MIDLTTDIQSLSHFKRNTPKVMAKLKKTGRPLVLTVNGRAAAVVMDATVYQKISEQNDQEEMRQFLAKSKADVKAGRTVLAREFLLSLGKERRTKKT